MASAQDPGEVLVLTEPTSLWVGDSWNELLPQGHIQFARNRDRGLLTLHMICIMS